MSNENWVSFYSFMILLGAIVTAIGIYKRDEVSERIKREEARANANSGVITSNPKKGQIVKPTSFEVRFGGNSYQDQIPLKEGAPVQFDLFGSGIRNSIYIPDLEPVNFRYKNKKILISTKIFDKSGKIVCEIVDNNWSVSPNNIYKRNYDDRALEVIDQEGNVALSVELLDNNIIELQGIFISSSGNCVMVSNESMYIFKHEPKSNANNRAKLDLEKYNREAKLIKRKFVYAGRDYFGKRIE